MLLKKAFFSSGFIKIFPIASFRGKQAFYALSNVSFTFTVSLQNLLALLRCSIFQSNYKHNGAVLFPRHTASQRSSCSVFRLSTGTNGSIKVSSLVAAAGGKCHSYEWRTGAWSNNRRAVWCQRSDGVNVTGQELCVWCVCVSEKDVRDSVR